MKKLTKTSKILRKFSKNFSKILQKNVKKIQKIREDEQKKHSHCKNKKNMGTQAGRTEAGGKIHDNVYSYNKK